MTIASADLSNIKAGDMIATARNGWEGVTEIISDVTYPVQTNISSYTFDGKYTKDDKCPSAWAVPPIDLGFGPKPVKLEKGDQVMVRDVGHFPWRRRYFSHMKGDEFICFTDGCDEWSSKGETLGWLKCRKWEPENDNS